MLALTNFTHYPQDNPIAKKVLFAKRTQLCALLSTTSLKIGYSKKPILTQFPPKKGPKTPQKTENQPSRATQPLPKTATKKSKPTIR